MFEWTKLLQLLQVDTLQRSLSCLHVQRCAVFERAWWCRGRDWIRNKTKCCVSATVGGRWNALTAGANLSFPNVVFLLYWYSHAEQPRSMCSRKSCDARRSLRSMACIPISTFWELAVTSLYNHGNPGDASSENNLLGICSSIFKIPCEAPLRSRRIHVIQHASPPIFATA